MLMPTPECWITAARLPTRVRRPTPPVLIAIECCLLQPALAPDAAAAPSSLPPCSEFGLSHDSYKEFHPLMIYYSKQVGRGSCGC